MKNILICLLIAISVNGISQIPADTSLIAYWAFTGNSIDNSSDGNNGKVHGAMLTTDRFGNEDCAYYFDGLDDYIELPVLNRLNNQSKITVSLWLKTDFDFSGHYSIFFGHWRTTAGEGDGPIGIEMFLSKNSYKHESAISVAMTSAKNSWTQDKIIAPGEWNHVVIVYDGTQKDYLKRLGIYVNNIFKGYFGDENIPEVSGNSSDMTIIGAQVYTTLLNFYKGSIDDMAIWNRNLSSEEIAILFNYRTYGKNKKAAKALLPNRRHKVSNQETGKKKV